MYESVRTHMNDICLWQIKHGKISKNCVCTYISARLYSELHLNPPGAQKRKFPGGGAEDFFFQIWLGGRRFARGGAPDHFGMPGGGRPPPLFCASETLDAVCTLYVIVYAICIVQYTYLSNYVLHEYNMMVSLYLSCIMVCACMYVECTSYMFVMQTICGGGGGGWRVGVGGIPTILPFYTLTPLLKSEKKLLLSSVFR